MLDLRRLRLLRELARRGTITAVAKALSYSPSAVSQQLAALEKEAGVRLLKPAGRRVRLTPQGDLLVEHTQVLLEEMERAVAAQPRLASIRDGTRRDHRPEMGDVDVPTSGVRARRALYHHRPADPPATRRERPCSRFATRLVRCQ